MLLASTDVKEPVANEILLAGGPPEIISSPVTFRRDVFVILVVTVSRTKFDEIVAEPPPPPPPPLPMVYCCPEELKIAPVMTKLEMDALEHTDIPVTVRLEVVVELGPILT
jgi:hypothetical protein